MRRSMKAVHVLIVKKHWALSPRPERWVIRCSVFQLPQTLPRGALFVSMTGGLQRTMRPGLVVGLAGTRCRSAGPRRQSGEGCAMAGGMASITPANAAAAASPERLMGKSFCRRVDSRCIG